MTDSRFKRNLKLAAVAHFGVVVVLICSSFCRSFLDRRRNIEIPVEFTVEYPNKVEQPQSRKSAAIPQVMEQPKPKQRETPPQKNEPRIAPEPMPKPKPQPKSRPPQTQPLPRVAAPAVIRERKIEAPRRTLSEEEIRRLLEKGARLSDETRIPSDEAIYREIIRKTFYDAWLQPSKAEAGDAVTEVSLCLGAGGIILSRRIIKSSGNSVFDASVLEAISRVNRIVGLSPDFLIRNPEVKISFRVE